MPLDISGDIAGLGKIVQIVRATDTTNRTINSTTYVDAGLSVTITPKKSDSAVILIATYPITHLVGVDTTLTVGRLQITDSSNIAVSGAEESRIGDYNVRLTGGATISHTRVPVTMIGYATPNTTSAVTYKTRGNVYFVGTSLDIILLNATATAQLYAIEVAA